MSATARKHDVDPVDPVDAHEVDAAAIAGDQGTEYATRGARAQRAQRPHLRMVSPLRPERASRGVFALVVTGLLGVGMVLILVINTSLAQGAFTVSELQAEQATLSQQEQALSEQVAAAAAPENLEQQARALGMVPSENPVFLSLPGGKVLGKPKPAAGARTSTPRLLTPADATATEAVDAAAAADLPAPLPADYDPAAADAAAQQAKAANDAAIAAETAADTAAAAKAAKKAAKNGAGANAKKGAAAGENQLWQDSTVMDVNVGSGDADLVAVPVG